MSGQIAIQPISIKKAWKFLNSLMAIRQYTSHLAVHTQTQMQTESEAFRTHLKGHGTRDTLPPGKDMEPGTRKGPGTRDTLPLPRTD